MGTGTVTLLWYVACSLVVGFILATTAGIMAYAKRQDRKKAKARAARRAARQEAKEAGGTRSPNEDAAPSASD
ncbi:MAG: hypothetical protein AAF447_03025 [Myxococcota bacterium]